MNKNVKNEFKRVKYFSSHIIHIIKTFAPAFLKLFCGEAKDVYIHLRGMKKLRSESLSKRRSKFAFNESWNFQVPLVQFKHLFVMISDQSNIHRCRLSPMCCFPHLYSPNVPSSSFIGWISGSWWASSFSFTVRSKSTSCMPLVRLFPTKEFPRFTCLFKTSHIKFIHSLTWIFASFVPLYKANDE